MARKWLPRRSASRWTREGGCGGFSVRVLLLLGFVGAGVTYVHAQVPAGSAPAYTSASGVVAFGFPAMVPDTTVKRDAASIFPQRSELSGPARQLIEQVWRVSPTFRRQCARLVEASVEVTVSFDFPRHRSEANAETVMTRGARLRAHIHLRGGDTSAAEHLAHEIEHVLEQLDEVDLSLAVADRVHGAKLADGPAAFETSRAIAVGEQVAREVRSNSGWR
jgi:hypothetical protein